jgi:tetratricopeptide (TPR) repeat protein
MRKATSPVPQQTSSAALAWLQVQAPDQTLFPTAVPPEALQVVDQVVAPRDGGEECLHLAGPLGAWAVIAVAHARDASLELAAGSKLCCGEGLILTLDKGCGLRHNAPGMAVALTPSEVAQLAQTIEMFEVITQSQPLDYASLEILKEAYLKLDRHQDVVNTSKRIAQAYVQLGQLSSAILEYEGILQQFPGDPDVRAALAEIESQAGSLASNGGETELLGHVPQPMARPAAQPPRWTTGERPCANFSSTGS